MTEITGYGVSKMRQPPVAAFALALRDALRITDFIETGTYHGGSAFWAAEHFERVVSIEIDIKHYLAARARLTDGCKVSLLYGDSRVVLPHVVKLLRHPALFFLDAHNFDRAFRELPDDCPIEVELEEIFASPYPHVVLIDDAANFATPASEAFPQIGRLTGLAEAHGYRHGTAHDVLALVPPAASAVLDGFLAKSGGLMTASATVIRGDRS